MTGRGNLVKHKYCIQEIDGCVVVGVVECQKDKIPFIHNKYHKSCSYDHVINWKLYTKN